MELRFFDDPVAFLDEAGPSLAAQPVLSTVIAGIAERIRDQRAAGIAWPEGVPCWFAVVVDGGQIVGTAMRTAPFGDHPAYLMPMPDEAVHLLSAALLARGEPVLGANGALPAVQVFCEEWPPRPDAERWSVSTRASSSSVTWWFRHRSRGGSDRRRRTSGTSCRPGSERS